MHGNSELPSSNERQTALVLFSGGQDSTVALAWALTHFVCVETIGFNYNQRHQVELEARDRVLARIGDINSSWRTRIGPDRVVDLEVLSQVSPSALTRDLPIETGKSGLPTSFVPGRNLLFFTLAAAVAYARGIKHLVGGMCETDFSGYPDCRDDTIKALQVTLNLGMDARFIIDTPLMWIDKAATWALAHELGGGALVDLIIEETHTCYHGDRVHRHAWGYGCGTCPACELRAKGFFAWKGI
jgi:7-cyano-7-deazaguanine synthase